MKKTNNLIAKNKKAYLDYEIITSYEWWIKLFWHEVKSIRLWNVNLKWSYLSIINWEVYLKWAHISVLSSLPSSWVEPARERKVLLKRKDIDYLSWKIKEAWYSLIPLEFYFVWSLIKVKVWLCKWRKNYQKKQVLKERAIDKQAKIAMKKFL